MDAHKDMPPNSRLMKLPTEIIYRVLSPLDKETTQKEYQSKLQRSTWGSLISEEASSGLGESKAILSRIPNRTPKPTSFRCLQQGLEEMNFEELSWTNVHTM